MFLTIKRLTFGTAIVAAVLLTARDTRAQILFQEDWNSGISPATWNLFGGSGGAFTFDLGLTGQGATGDSALFLRDASFTYAKGLRSTASYSRAAAPGGLKTSFKLFRELSGVLDFTTVGGPWANLGAPSGSLPDIEDIEAGITTGQPNTNRIYYAEDTAGANQWAQNPLSSDFFAALLAATTKALALDVSVTVGNPAGARLEWSLGGGPTTVEYDTLGEVAGTPWTSLVPPLGTPGNGSRVSSTTPIWLSFGGIGNGTTFASAIVDDVVVTAIPEPAGGVLVALGFAAMAAACRRK